MSRPFRRHGDAIRMQLSTAEVELLEALRGDLAALLSDPDGRDPVTRRLFPATVTGDDEADHELRRLIHEDLLESRLAALDELLEILERGSERRGALTVELTEEEPTVVLGVLNDLRLALGARVGIERLDRSDLATMDEATLNTLAVMDHLAGLQEMLLSVLDPASIRHYDEGHELDD